MSSVLHYRLFGPDTFSEQQIENTPLLVVHGLFGEGENWSSYAKLWAQHRLVVAVDLPFHGKSEGHVGDLAYKNIADRLADTLQTLDNPGPWAVLGHSMGGKAAMTLALKYPELVKALVVVDIAPKTYPRAHDDVFAAISCVDLKAIKSRSEAELCMRSNLPDQMVRGFILKALIPPSAEKPAWSWKFSVSDILESYEDIRGWPPAFEGKTWPGPVLFIRGADSPYVAQEDYENVLQYFPKAEFKVVANAGHWVQAQNRQGFLEALETFVYFFS